MAKRVDGNQNQITKELRDLGFSVGLIHEVGNGIPDIIVGFFDCLNIIVELKVDEKKKLTNKEAEFFQNWMGQVSKNCSTLSIIDELFDTLTKIVENKDEMFDLLKQIREIYEQQIH